MFCHFVASMISGLITTIASMPVDIAKTRIQTMKVMDGKPEYNGALVSTAGGWLPLFGVRAVIKRRTAGGRQTGKSGRGWGAKFCCDALVGCGFAAVVAALVMRRHMRRSRRMAGGRATCGERLFL